MNTLHFLVACLVGLPVKSKQFEAIWHGVPSIAQSRLPHFPEQLFPKTIFVKIACCNEPARAVPNIVDRDCVHTLLQFRRGRMQRKQIPCESRQGLKAVGQWAKASTAVLFVAILASLSGCKIYLVNVEVPVKPKFIPPGNIKEFEVRNFEGPPECAKDLQSGIHARAANAGDLAPRIPGLPDLDGPLEVRGRVEGCSMRMGYGMLNATMILSHGGKQLYQEIVREETNRPGASIEEVRTVLVDRAIKQFASIFVPGKRSEIREGRPLGSNDPGWAAAEAKNWKFAVELWSKQITQTPNDARAWYNRGIAHEGLGDFEKAVADYKKAAELDQDEVYIQALVRANKFLEDMSLMNAAKKSRE